MFVSKLNKKGAITLPKAARVAMGLKPGSTVKIHVRKDGTAVVYPQREGVDHLLAMFDYQGPRVSQADIDEAGAEGAGS
jgi:AbrB family looped-hinge helix DNA binding protein